MKRIFPILTRLFLLTVVLGGAFVFLSSQTQGLKVPAFNTSKLTGLAKEKFIDQQPIISDEKPKTVVLGENTSAVVSDQAKQVVSKTTTLVTNELKNLPKKEAAKILRQTCEQIAADLEK